MKLNEQKLDIYRSKRRFALLLYILCSIFMVGSIVINSIAFSNEPFVVEDREMNNFFNEMANKDISYFYTNTIFLNKEKKTAESMFRSIYTKNLSDDGYQHILSVSDKETTLKANISFCGQNLPFKSAVGNSLVYSNKENPPSFETLLINLFKYRPRSEEISYDSNKYAGFIYIPDYYADYIIEHNNSYSSYNDFFTNETSLTLTIYGKKLDYKVANIFCINGFKKEYCDGVETKTPYKYGKLLNDYFNDFCIVSNTSAIVELSNDLHLSVVSLLIAKRFLLMDTLRNVKNTSKNNDDSASVNLFYTTGKGVVYYKNSSSFSNSFLYPQSNAGWGLKIVGLVIYFLSIMLLSFVFYKYFYEKSFYIFTFSEIGFFTFVFLLFSIFKHTSLISKISIYFNGVTVIAIIIYLLCLLLLASSVFVRKQRNK